MRQPQQPRQPRRPELRSGAVPSIAAAPQAQLAAIVESSDDAIIGKTLAGIITSWNTSAERLYGYSAAEVIGRSISIIIPPERPDELPGIMARLARGQRIDHFETVRRRKDGSRVQVSVTISPILDAAGAVVGASAIARDVTAQKLLQERLREQEERLRFVLESAQVGVWEWNLTGGELHWSPQLELLHGLQPGTFAGTYEAFLALIHPDDRARVVATIAGALETGAPYRMEFRVVPPDGRVRWIGGQGRAHHDADGRPVRMLGLAWDITARREADAELRRSRDQLAAIFSSVADGITVQGEGRRLLYANDAAAQLIGFPDAETLLHAAPGEYLKWYRLADEQGQPLNVEELPGPRARRTTQPAEGTICYRHVDTGELRWSHVRTVPVLDESGVVQFTVSATQDVTALKQAEAAVRLLADAGAVLAGPLDDEEMPARLAGLLAERLGGYCVIELAQPDGSLQPVAAVHRDPEVQPALAALVAGSAPGGPAPIPTQQVVQTGEPVFWQGTEHAGPATRARRAARGDRAALEPRTALAVPLLAGGRTLGALRAVSVEGSPPLRYADLEVLQEVGRRAGLALENARLYREAREAVALRDHFLSIASHELRTPLTSLKGQLELGVRRLRRGAPTPDVDRSLSVALGQVERLTRLVGGMLDISRLAGGRLTIAPEPVQVDGLLRHVLEIERAVEPPREIVCQVDDADAEVWGDPVRLEQVLVNLLENARKYSPQETVIRLAAVCAPETVAITVRDEGIGIPPEEQEQIFAPFRRAGNVDQGIAGLGLGLAIAREIVHLHGGELTVESEPGAGSTFTLVLPRYVPTG